MTDDINRVSLYFKNNLFKEKCYLIGFTSAHLNLSPVFFFLAQENEIFSKTLKRF